MRLAFFLFLLLRFSQARDAKCAEFYYTKEITEEEAIGFDYYYTAANVTTTKECAVFCAERRFCRSAIYDQTMKACAISYEYTENCRNQRIRYTEDNPIVTNQTLLITCIGKCTEHREYEIRRSQAHGRVNIITGEPHNGFLPPIVVEDGNKLKNIKRREQSFLRKSVNAIGKKERPAIIVGDAHDRTSTSVESTKGEGYVNSLIVSNLTGIRPVASSDIRRADPKRNRAGDPPICFRTKKRRYLLGGSFRHVPHTTIDHCRCLCANSWRDSARCESLNYYTNGMCVLNTGSHKGRFDLIDDPSATYQYVACDISMLIGIADIVCDNSDSEIPPKPMEQVFTKVWKESKERKDSSSVELTTQSPEREEKKVQTSTAAAVLTTTAPPTTTTTAETTTVQITERTTQQEVTEDDDLAQLRKKLEEVEKEISEEVKREKILKEKEAELRRIGEKTKLEEERRRQDEENKKKEEKKVEEERIRKEEEEKKKEEKRKEEEEKEKKKEQKRIEEEEEKKKEQKRKEEEEEKARKEAKELEEREKEEKRKEEIKKNEISDEEEDEEEKPKKKKKARRGKKENEEEEESSTTSNIEVTKQSKKEKCFEELFDYVMTSTAGGLEHDVSIDECKCLCANSMTSGRYAFQCRSATYYHNERDCVLNVESRRQRPELLERHYRKTYNVTYLGLQCSIMKAVMDLVNPRLEAGCIQPFAVTAAPTTTTTEKTTTPSVRSETGTDSCFLELPHFVLEGTAQAVETEVSVEECKCKCADAERKYGEPCQSAQYFPEERICLLNKKNRFSNPESFNYVPLSPQSYFESKCVSKEDNRAHYLESKCAAYVKVERRKLREDESPEKLDTPEELIEEKKSSKRDQVKETELKKSKKEGKTASRNHQKKIDHQDDPAAEKTNSLIDRESEPAPTTTTSTTTSTTTTTTAAPTTTTSTTTATAATTTTTTTKKPSSKATKKVTKPKREPSTTSTTTTTTTTHRPTTTTTRFRDTVKINLAIPEAEGFDSAELEEFMIHEELMSKEVMDDVIEEAMKSSKEETVAASDNSLSDDDKPLSRDYMPESEEEDEEGSSAEVNNTIMEDEAEMYAPRTLHQPSTRPPSTVAPQTTVSTTVTTPAPTTTTVPTTTTTTASTTEAPTTTSASETTTEDDEEEEEVTTTIEPTTEEPTTTTTEYPPAGPCTYSAIYQTTFHGNKLLKVVSVKSPADCFAACYALGCRSANLYSAGTCELFKDALIDYRRPDVVSYEHGAVYFDGIQCQGPPKVVESP